MQTHPLTKEKKIETKNRTHIPDAEAARGRLATPPRATGIYQLYCLALLLALPAVVTLVVDAEAA